MAKSKAEMNFLLVCFAVFSCVSSIPTEYNVGIGIADITGPAAEVNMMGYANPSQTTAGIHLRQFSRAFIFEDDNKNRVVFVNIDACMFSVGLKLELVKRLQTKYGNLYTDENICVSGTHTHSGAAGFHQYILFDITSLGFVKETFDSLIDGIEKSIDRAHATVQPANLYMNTGELLESNINRSPSAYLYNPPEERAKYSYNVDKNMTVMRIVDADDKPIGMISWFAVHCTSMNNTNHLISSDNKGLASLMFEADINGQNIFPGKGKFVAAFGQANEGDVSPNTKGPHCMDTGLPCDTNTSTCNGRNEQCVSPGPGKDMFESTKIIATNQYQKAMDLFNSATTKLSGPVDYRHTFSDMTQQTVGEGKKTCKAAMGYSFAAGTTDGPGAFDFTQGETSTSPLWNFVSGLLHKPSPEQVACHKPKPILLDTGEIDIPYAWEPAILPNQILRIGQLVLIAVPAEFTTMSGRRLRDTVEQAFVAAGSEKPMTVIAGLSNDYSDYVTTFQEYQDQRYEGGSTVYGPHTLEAYQMIFANLSTAMAEGSPVAAGPAPPNLISKQLSFLPGVIYDEAGVGRNFGDVRIKPAKQYKPGQRVSVQFQGANPRNDRKAESTFLEVLFQEQDGNWTVQYTDAHWETTFAWTSLSTIFGESAITITWDIPANQKPGVYKIKYYGNSKAAFTETITPFTGSTETFTVASSSAKWNKYLNKQKLALKENGIQKKKNLFKKYFKNMKSKSANSI